MSRMHVFCAALSVAAACTLHSAAFAGSGTSGNDAPTLGSHGNSSTDTRHPSESPEQKKARALLDAGIQAFDRAGYAQALPLFQQADEAGHMKAPRYIGLMYLNAFGVKKDEGRAFAEFQKAANRGDITGQFMLATMYEQGMGITQNLDMAIHWYRISAQRGDRIAAPAMSALGPRVTAARWLPCSGWVSTLARLHRPAQRPPLPLQPGTDHAPSGQPVSSCAAGKSTPARARCHRHTPTWRYAPMRRPRWPRPPF